MRLSLLAAVVIPFCPVLALAQSSSGELKRPRVCVALVENTSTVSAYEERLTERLVKSLRRDKLEAVAMDSSTTKEHTLRPTRQNTDEADSKQCGYTLLTQIVETRTSPAAPETAPWAGARVPSVDTSEPTGGRSGPVYREELGIAFALFRTSRYDPVLNTFILERASANVSDTFLVAMDKIANRVSREVKKK
ncbi:MAG: hypothetical protein LAO23_10050 [Acidobacteriia bacterium]|nr:hypothetical protein [Terriglobia bacterium]